MVQALRSVLTIASPLLGPTLERVEAFPVEQRHPERRYTMSTMMTMMPATDAITSIPLHQSTLRVLQRVKSAAETWDEFLINVTDDYLSPSLRAELDRRL